MMKYGKGIRESTYVHVIDRLARHAPAMPVAEATRLAEELANATAEEFILKSAMAVLSELLGFSDNGSAPDRLKGSDNAVLWALGMVTDCHAWVVCGPEVDGMARLKAQVIETLGETK